MGSTSLERRTCFRIHPHYALIFQVGYCFLGLALSINYKDTSGKSTLGIAAISALVIVFLFVS